MHNLQSIFSHASSTILCRSHQVGAVVHPWSISASHVECHPSQIATWRGERRAEQRLGVRGRRRGSVLEERKPVNSNRSPLQNRDVSCQHPKIGLNCPATNGSSLNKINSIFCPIKNPIFHVFQKIPVFMTCGHRSCNLPYLVMTFGHWS